MTKDETLKMALGVTHCQCEACKNGNIHDSDCSVHNGDALPVGPCDCSLATPPLPVQPEPLEYWNAVEGWVKIDEVREHFESVGCGTIYKNGGEGRVPLYTAPPQQQAEPVAWDKPSASFDEWWDSDRRRDNANPFTTDSFAYWAWEGWQAARLKEKNA